MSSSLLVRRNKDVKKGYANLTDNQFASRGGEAYEELCAQCHGAAGVGGQAAFTILDEQGRYVSGVNWTAPSLNAILYRFTETEVTHILNYGRPQSPMPAWGAPGGGPLTSQQIEELVAYLAAIQLTPEQMATEVKEGIRESVLSDVRDSVTDPTDEELKAAYNQLVNGLGDALENQRLVKANPESEIEQIEIADNAVLALLDQHIDDLAENNVVKYGEYLFNNPAGAGAYACARCHTAGSSWNANDVLAANPSLQGLVNPEGSWRRRIWSFPYWGNNTIRFSTRPISFISNGCEPNYQYGLNGVCEPSGQMPGFGPNATELEGALLSLEQIAAIVEYERGLND